MGYLLIFIFGIIDGFGIAIFLVRKGATYGDYTITFNQPTEEGNENSEYNIGIRFRNKDSIPSSKKIILYRDNSH